MAGAALCQHMSVYVCVCVFFRLLVTVPFVRCGRGKGSRCAEFVQNGLHCRFLKGMSRYSYVSKNIDRPSLFLASCLSGRGGEQIATKGQNKKQAAKWHMRLVAVEDLAPFAVNCLLLALMG